MGDCSLDFYSTALKKVTTSKGIAAYTTLGMNPFGTAIFYREILKNTKVKLYN